MDEELVKELAKEADEITEQALKEAGKGRHGIKWDEVYGTMFPLVFAKLWSQYER